MHLPHPTPTPPHEITLAHSPTRVDTNKPKHTHTHTLSLHLTPSFSLRIRQTCIQTCTHAHAPTRINIFYQFHSIGSETCSLRVYQRSKRGGAQCVYIMCVLRPCGCVVLSLRIQNFSLRCLWVWSPVRIGSNFNWGAVHVLQHVVGCIEVFGDMCAYVFLYV